MREWMQLVRVILVPVLRLVALALFVAWMTRVSWPEMTDTTRLLLYAYAVQMCVVMLLLAPAKRDIFRGKGAL